MNAQVLNYQSLKTAIENNSAAFRSRTRLQPAGGEGDKVFPPTYAGAKYATEDRRLKDAKVPCVLLDSVQAQANRLEEALQRALDAGTLKSVPVLNVDFTGLGLLDEVGRVSSLEAPHRIADAILRDSLHNGQSFRKSELGKSLDQASLHNATPLYKLCPTALIFGLWDSTGPKGGLGAKFQRALVSEIIGVNAQIGVKTSSRIDPLGMRAAAKVIKKPDGSYELAGDKAKDGVSPSEVNHGNIPPDINAVGGATLDYAEQTVVLSLPALRKLRFPVDGKTTPERDAAARTVLAALALTAAALAAESGFDLRSRCLLWPTDVMNWELLEAPGKAPATFTLTSADAIKLLEQAVMAAEKVGLVWQKEPVKLTPSPNLVALLKRSQDIAAKTPADATAQ
ncbi:MAG: type I-U CRISPR-associated RAMP protein Csb1/Cas7u [Verrucomicrobiales bacterium]|nr:type I-U CRISPR-associated RAMP protein Csb1/Cas7u [Verrucomicrobiales bacterium]